MSAISGFVGGVLALSLFEAVLSSDQATGRVGGIFTGASTLLAHLSSPDVPAIPDLRQGSAATSSAYLAPPSSSSSTAPTVASPAPSTPPSTGPGSTSPKPSILRNRFANV